MIIDKESYIIYKENIKSLTALKENKITIEDYAQFVRENIEQFAEDTLCKLILNTKNEILHEILEYSSYE